MTIEIIRRYRCDGCQKEVERKPAWVHVLISGTYETEAVLITTSPDRESDYCRECWKLMIRALNKRDGNG